MIKTIGRGSYSKVRLAEHIQQNRKYAVKVIDKRALEKKKKGFFKDEGGKIIVNSMLQDSLREIAILKKLNNKHVIKLEEIMYDEDSGKIYLGKLKNHLIFSTFSNGVLWQRTSNEKRRFYRRISFK
jgi:serine/threonine protein kinase